ncbi:MAG: CHASE2 domain-containing protein [Symploca sp. SIO2G7]|nr:CHASE2 domain-containing protein [Symploca sp. SIO2G7]
MGKLVILKLGDGNFEQGFTVTLQMGEDGQLFSLEITGKLPPAPEIRQYYSGWVQSYEGLGLRSRLEKPTAQITNVSLKSLKENCLNAAQVLRVRFNRWLRSEPFDPIREKLLEQLIPADEIRLVIQTENIWLRKLPWHLWDLCDRYPKIEIAISALNVQKQDDLPDAVTDKVKILAIIGNSTGINIQADRQLLEQLPDAEVSFLVEPQRQELTDELWRQDWDIFFFAGHSSSQDNGAIGRMYINQTDSLTIENLKNALKKAVERGLKIAIFNSCDGLGLARNLTDLQIPQVIVMREPVPDRVAQEFLKYFLEAFARGESLYLAVREARERLQALEDKFPCATWLPMICQNPTVLPPTWQDLCGNYIQEIAPITVPEPELQPRLLQQPPSLKGKRGLLTVSLLSLVVTFLLMGIRYLGIFQSLELQAFDHLMSKRPVEFPDSRLLIVKVTEQDVIAQPQQERRGSSLSDKTLAQLLAILESYQPRAIGLDLYRDFPVGAEHPDLKQRLQDSIYLVGVCKVSNPQTQDPGVKPPPEMSIENLSFSDIVLDQDNVIRRHLLALTPEPASICQASYSFSSELAFRYLEAEGISPIFTKDHHLQLGDTIFKRLEPHTGGYQNIDAGAHQILLNYRSHQNHSLQDFVPNITVGEILEGKLNPEMVKGRIVLIGVTARSFNDYLSTPNNQGQKQMPGVVVQAHMVSQILSAVLDERPLIGAWALWGEVLWVWCWSLAGGLIVWRFRLWLQLALVTGALVILYGLSLVLLIQGIWVPLVPSAIVLVSTGGMVIAYIKILYQSRLPTRG